MTNFRNFIQRKKLKKNHVDISYFVQCISACLLISLQSWIGSSVLEFISVPRASLFNSQQSFLCNPCHNRKRHNTKQFFCSFMRSPLSELSIHYSSIWCTRSSSFKTIVNYNLRAQNYCERTSFFFIDKNTPIFILCCILFSGKLNSNNQISWYNWILFYIIYIVTTLIDYSVM